MEEEIWIAIPTLEKFEISTFGKIRNKETKFIYKTHPNNPPKDMRARVGLPVNGRQRSFSIARLLLMAFVRLPLPGEFARHLDDNQSNEKLDNLAWGYHEDNVEDARRNRRYRTGYSWNKGIPASEESKEKRRLAMQGFRHEVETIKRISQTKMGHEVTDETREKLRIINTGKELSEETKIKIGLGNLGKVLSEETKVKMSVSRTREVIAQAAAQRVANAKADLGIENLRAIREALGMTLREFANMYDFSWQSVYNWERGAKTPRKAARETYKAIKEYLEENNLL